MFLERNIFLDIAESNKNTAPVGCQNNNFSKISIFCQRYKKIQYYSLKFQRSVPSFIFFSFSASVSLVYSPVPLQFEVFDHEAIEAIYRRSSMSTSLIFTLSHSSVFAQLPIHSLLCSHSKILKNEVTRTAVRTLLSSNLSCSSLEIRAVNAEISSALYVKLNSPAERVKYERSMRRNNRPMNKSHTDNVQFS